MPWRGAAVVRAREDPARHATIRTSAAATLGQTTMRKRPCPTPPPDPDDVALFRDAIGPVRPLTHTPNAAPAPPKPKPEPRQHALDEREALRQSQVDPFAHAELALGDALEYLKDGHPPRLLRRLKRGYYSVQDEIDLHRMTSAEAEQAIRVFLADCHRHGRLSVRIVHGKGLRSAGEAPILKNLTDRMLRQRADVLAFASTQPQHGGTGAVLVLLLP